MALPSISHAKNDEHFVNCDSELRDVFRLRALLDLRLTTFVSKDLKLICFSASSKVLKPNCFSTFSAFFILGARAPHQNENQKSMCLNPCAQRKIFSAMLSTAAADERCLLPLHTPSCQYSLRFRKLLSPAQKKRPTLI